MWFMVDWQPPLSMHQQQQKSCITRHRLSPSLMSSFNHNLRRGFEEATRGLSCASFTWIKAIGKEKFFGQHHRWGWQSICNERSGIWGNYRLLVFLKPISNLIKHEYKRNLCIPQYSLHLWKPLRNWNMSMVIAVLLGNSSIAEKSNKAKKTKNPFPRQGEKIF